jgi:hypothetical protein
MALSIEWLRPLHLRHLGRDAMEADQALAESFRAGMTALRKNVGLSFVLYEGHEDKAV